MKAKGITFIYVNQPICEKVDNINKIRWNIIKPSFSEISEVATEKKTLFNVLSLR